MVPEMVKTRRFRCDGPLSLGLTLGAFRRGWRDPTTRFDDAGFWRATRTPEGPGSELLTVDRDGITVSAWGPGAGWLLEKAPELVGAHDDPSAFRAAHPVVRDLQRRMPGLRLGRTGAVMEALFPSILEQKVTGKEAWLAYAAIVKRYGEPAPGPAGLMLQPTPERLAGIPSYDLHPLGVERRRAETLRRTCRVAARMEEIVTMPFADAHRRLRTIPGVGVWTAAEVARVALGDPDAVSVGDYHLKNQVAWVLAGEPRATDERMLELLEPYRGQRARAVRLIEASGITAPRFGPRRPIRKLRQI
jgi:3-methyladenine DNA glycosylase/8-oxoguanine DNA glycosylase